MDLHVALQSSDPLYAIGWLSALFIIFFPLWFGPKLGSHTRTHFEKTWAYLLIVSYLAMTTLSIFRGEASLGTSLLFHMCGFSRLLMVGYLLTKSRWMGELVTFTGLAGGLQSLLTPEFTHGLHPLYVTDYYFNHASIVGIGLYIILVHKKPLGAHAWLRSFGRIQIMALIALVVNLFTGGNYMYLMSPPIVDNPLVVSSDTFPYLHVLFFELAALLNFGLIQLFLKRIKVRDHLGIPVR